MANRPTVRSADLTGRTHFLQTSLRAGIPLVLAAGSIVLMAPAVTAAVQCGTPAVPAVYRTVVTPAVYEVVVVTPERTETVVTAAVPAVYETVVFPAVAEVTATVLITAAIPAVTGVYHLWSNPPGNENGQEERWLEDGALPPGGENSQWVFEETDFAYIITPEVPAVYGTVVVTAGTAESTEERLVSGAIEEVTETRTIEAVTENRLVISEVTDEVLVARAVQAGPECPPDPSRDPLPDPSPDPVIEPTPNLDVDPKPEVRPASAVRARPAAVTAGVLPNTGAGENTMPLTGLAGLLLLLGSTLVGRSRRGRT